MVSDATENITNIEWRVDGKVRGVTKNIGGVESNITFQYDGLGNRIAKTEVESNTTTLYVRDAQGNLLAVYDSNANGEIGTPAYDLDITHNNKQVTETEEYKAVNTILSTNTTSENTVGPTGNLSYVAGQGITISPNFHVKPGGVFSAKIETVTNGGGNTDGMVLTEHHIFGSSRLGLEKRNLEITEETATLEQTFFENKVGDKRYELSNHLGNVLSVVTDRKLTVNGLLGPDVVAYNDYYPFGMLLPNRHANTSDYRYGFQGQEMDNEIKGEGNSLNYTFRMSDPRIGGRFFAPDPIQKKYPMLSPYQFASNSPIAKAEIEGLEGGWVIQGEKVVYKEGPTVEVANSFDTEEAANLALYSSSANNNYTPPGQPTFRQQTESREVLDKRKQKIESAMAQQKLMAQTFSNPGMQVAHGVYVGIPEGLMEVSGMMVVDKVADAYRFYKTVKRSRLIGNTLNKVDNVVHPEFLDNANEVFNLWKSAETKALSNINNSGKTVLGSFNDVTEDYITMAKREGASFFDLGEIWGQLIRNGQDPWLLNVKFLDKVASKGDDIILNVSKDQIRRGSYLKSEVDYLTKKKDYIWEGNSKLVKKRK